MASIIVSKLSDDGTERLRRRATRHRRSLGAEVRAIPERVAEEVESPADAAIASPTGSSA